MRRYKLENLDCANCAAKLENEIAGLENVRSVSIDFATLSMRIDTDDISSVKAVISRREPDIKVSKYTSGEDRQSHEKVFPLAGILLFSAGLLSTIPAARIAEWTTVILFALSYAVTGYNVLVKAAKNLSRAMILDEHFLMAVSTIGAIILGEMAEAAGVMVFYSVGEYFQNKALAGSRRSVKALMDLRPETATVISRDGRHETREASTVTPGETIIVMPGERIPLDGTIISGNSHVDSSTTTGEHRPVKVMEGEAVFSGHIVKDSSLIIRVDKPLEESSVSKILELVEKASLRKAKTEKFITRFSRYYTPVVVGGAILIAFIPPLFFTGQSLSDWVYRALVMLVISCPCALVISIPLGYFGGIGTASASGILVKGSDILDRLAKLKNIVFDKTGTITEGVFTVTEVVPANGFSEQDLLKSAAKAEQGSRHPIAVSIMEHAGIDQKAETSQTIYPGMGLSALADGKKILAGNDKLMKQMGIRHDLSDSQGTIVHVAVDSLYAGRITLGDKVKREAASSVSLLRSEGISSISMLTGDNAHPAAQAAAAAGIDKYYYNLNPEDKVKKLESIMETNRGCTAFAGDGVNDAPVIMRADIGISMGRAGTDAAIESSDLVLMDDDLSLIPKAVKIARKTKAIVLENILFALGIKLLFLVSGAMGTASMWGAVFADIGVALIALFNAMRIQHMKK